MTGSSDVLRQFPLNLGRSCVDESDMHIEIWDQIHNGASSDLLPHLLEGIRRTPDNPPKCMIRQKASLPCDFGGPRRRFTTGNRIIPLKSVKKNRK